jgi:hypothetical protein
MTTTVKELADISLSDPAGTAHRLGDLWSVDAHVLLFLRHFG